MALRRFWNADGTGEAEYVLKRDPKHAGHFSLEQQFQYRDPDRGTFTVPKAGVDWRTNLASVPAPAAWLVPKDGTHTPAALVHDALVLRPGEPKAHEGPDVTREEADLIFREAMQHLSVPFLRRWMMWAAVMLATLCTPGEGRRFWRWRLTIVPITIALLVLGFVSVLDVFDVPPVELPWMGDAGVWEEIAGGFAVAVGALVATVVVFASRWQVGLVAGLVLIPFAFPLVVSAVAYAIYQALEVIVYWVLKRLAPPTPEEPVPAPNVLRRMTSAE